jgi:glutamate dehydrogenase
MSDPADVRDRAIVEDICRSAGEVSPLVATFARAYVQRIPHHRLHRVDEDELCAHVRGMVEFASVRPGREPLVRVFNPTLAEHGYTSAGTVVDIVATDAPFLIDSMTMALSAGGFTVEELVHPVIGIVRDPDGVLTDITPARGAPMRESVQHYELDRRLTDEEMVDLDEVARRVLRDVRQASDDFEPMQGAVYRMMKIAREGAARYSTAEIAETVDFLEWLLEDHFVFLGYREYEITDGDEGRVIAAVAHSGLGILSDSNESRFRRPVPLAELASGLRQRYELGDQIVVTKTNSYSRVHRRARMDYIGVRRVDEHGQVSGEARLVGLFTSKAYMEPAEEIPLLRQRLRSIIDSEDAIAGSHHFKQIVQLFNSIPKEELFATPTADIRTSIVGLIEAQERENVRLFVRRDLLQRNVSVLVVLPRDRFNADLRKNLQELMERRLGGTSVDYRLALGDSDTARIHFTVWTKEGETPSVDVERLEAEVIDMSRSWDERLLDELSDELGQSRGAELAHRWAPAFPDSYRSSAPLWVAAQDTLSLEALTGGESPVVAVRPSVAGAPVTHITIYRAGGPLALSEIMPTLEHFGLRVIDEIPTTLLNGDVELHIHNFRVSQRDGDVLDVDRCGERLGETITAVLRGRAETDSLNRLIPSSGLTHEDVAILRAYRTYWQRVAGEFTAPYMNDALAAHPDIAASLIQLFHSRFNPASVDDAAEAALGAQIIEALESVETLDEDRILRGFLHLVLATVRTNAFQAEARSLTFKFRSRDVPGVPAPVPLFEIFVYAPEVEGIHLRGGRIARGGIRWSVRREDYRAEVLGLMKAQMTKNAVIVPTGAKGGFVLRDGDPRPSPDAIRTGYSIFIRGLLDVTDNLVAGETIHPADVTVHDEPDPYMVVAADKGTASFSDTANGLSAEYDFWLGDAFASGGSAGYDHKALGITARGAWESVRWHLRELDIDPDSQPFTAVGIGDMSGDVFGNGMLLSSQLRLIAAFDHRHLFIDPDPDPERSWDERSRLFALPASSWDDYDRDLISSGGGVWPRSAKSIPLSDEARAALGFDKASGTPEEIISAILRAPVDLLWNGGVGTFVKASTETHAQVDDRGNDGSRVDASDLRCRVVGEGGNLGLTQRARIEFAGGGGKVFTDFIDNSGGVNCSDREVNLKILLGQALQKGTLGTEERDRLVADVADDVVAAILYDNFLQAQVLSQEWHAAPARLEAYEDLMSHLERDGFLDRRIEYLPSTEEIHERIQAGEGMYGPELSVLLTYAKRSLTIQLLASDLPDDPELAAELEDYFPGAITARFRDLLPEHPLRRELIATLVANRVINSEGITFVSRLAADTAATGEQVVRAYRVARIITRASERWRAVEALVAHVPPELQRHLLDGIDGLVEEVTRWQLTHTDRRSMAERIEAFSGGFDALAAGITEVGPEAWQRVRELARTTLIESAVPEPVALSHAYLHDLEHGCDIIEVASAADQPVLDVARLFFHIGSAVQIDWLQERVEEVQARNNWQRQALRVLTDDLAQLRRRFAEQILADSADLSPSLAYDHFLADRAHEIGHLTRFFRSIVVDGSPEISSLLVGIRRVEQLLRA